MKQPLLLCILDGFGIATPSKTNAISEAHMKNWKILLDTYPNTELEASGLAVGLPEGQMGNSEVGHLHIGAGRTIYQSLTLINKSISEKTFFQNEKIKQAIDEAKAKKASVHIIGLLSDGGVHAHINHIIALLEYCKQENFNDVYVQAILDGRDTKSDVAKNYLNQLLVAMKTIGVGQIASVSGRYYAMDRDKRWERLKLAYDVMVNHQGQTFTDLITYIDSEYQLGRNDEFIIPAYNEETSKGNIKENDSIIFANFRPDRAIQLASSLTNSNYGFNKEYQILAIPNTYFISMMLYADSVKSNGLIFPPVNFANGLGEWLSKEKKTQLRIAETEKYAHVTYFFDGGQDIEYPFEKRILIPSPKVQTYDLKPEMSAFAITEALEEIIAKNEYDIIILNYANPDMVGHTGNLEATIDAIKTIDECLGKLQSALEKVNGILVITADHGNAEIMVDEQGDINKKHTSQKVPFIVCKTEISLEEGGSLANVAPTVLALMNLPIPKEMTAKSLLK